MPAVELTKNQENLRQAIQTELDEIHRLYSVEGGLGSEREKIHTLTKDLGRKAHQLHIELKKSGNEPRHHKYMIENRRVSPDKLEFFEHIHPVEDLLSFIEDPTANDDPIDQTIGEIFDFPVYSNRWGHNDNYKIKRTKDGWEIDFMSGGKCDKRGYPYLFKNLEHDGIEYPKSLGSRMQWLWEKAKDSGLSKEQLQKELSELAEWISEIERNQPKQGVWAGF